MSVRELCCCQNPSRVRIAGTRTAGVNSNIDELYPVNQRRE